MTQKDWYHTNAYDNGENSIRRRTSHVVRTVFFYIGCLAKLASKIGGKRRQTMLLVRLDSLGDLALFAPALRRIRSQFPEKKLILVAQKHIAGLAGTCPYVDGVIPVDVHRYRVNPVYALCVLHEVRSLRCETSVNSMYSRTLVGDEIVMWSSAPDSVGWLGEWGDVHTDLKGLHDRQYTRLILDQFPPDVHEYHRHGVLLRALGCSEDQDLRPELWQLPNAGIKGLSISRMFDSNDFAILVPGADSKIRRWPFSSYLELAKKIGDKSPDLQIILLGTASERDLDSSDNPSTFPTNILDLRGKTTLLDIASIIENARFVAGNETGPIHLAIAIGVPTVAILGGGKYGRFLPYGEPTKHKTVTNYLGCYHCDWRCSLRVTECIIGIPVSKVWEEVLQILEPAGKPCG